MAGAWIGFYPGGVAAVGEGYVLEDDVIDVVGLRGNGADAADAHCA